MSGQNKDSQGGTMTQEPRWYAERFRDLIATKLQTKFNQSNATSSEIIEAIRSVPLDELVRDVQAYQAGNVSSGSGSNR